jgi:hypothetical protein
MSADTRRVELSVRRALRAVTSRIGTGPVSVSLLALAAIYQAAWWAWCAAGSGEGAAALVGSWPFEVLAGALLLDALVALARSSPLILGSKGEVRLAGRDALWPGLIRVGQLLVALAFVASLLSHDRFALRLAVGEEFVGGPGQVVDRDPPRPMSPGPFPLSFSLAGAEVTFDAAGVARGPRATLAFAEGATTTAPWRPVRLGFGRFLLPESAGIAVRFEIAGASGAPVDSAFVRLNVLPVGKVDALQPDGIPHRIYVALTDAPQPPPAVPPLRVAVYRGRLVVAEGLVAPGGELEFDGMKLRFPETRTWVGFGMVRDPGPGIAVIGALVAAAGFVAGAIERRRRAARA